MGMTLLATTGLTGYALVNGTGAILTWTAPNDGVMHRVMVVAVQDVTSSETGGAITVAITSPNNVSHSPSVFAGGSATGFQYFTTCYPVYPNASVTFQQNGALSAAQQRCGPSCGDHKETS